MTNQCFYLALAAGIGSQDLPAITLKRKREAAYLSRLPEWNQREVRRAPAHGTYGDVLNSGLQAVPALHARTVVIIYAEGARRGQVDIYRIPQMANNDEPVIGLWYTPGHFQLIKWTHPSGGPTLPQLLRHIRTPPGGGSPVPHIITDARWQ